MLFNKPTPQAEQAMQTRQRADELKAAVDAAAGQNLDHFLQIWNAFWFPANGLTTADLCAALGTDAAVFFADAQAFFNFRAALAANHGVPFTPPAPPREYRVNADGTVTVGRRWEDIPDGEAPIGGARPPRPA